MLLVTFIDNIHILILVLLVKLTIKSIYLYFLLCRHRSKVKKNLLVIYKDLCKAHNVTPKIELSRMFGDRHMSREAYWSFANMSLGPTQSMILNDIFVLQPLESKCFFEILHMATAELF